MKGWKERVVKPTAFSLDEQSDDKAHILRVMEEMKMNELQKVVQRAKADIAKQYVFVHMPIPQLETLLAGLEEQQREIEKVQKSQMQQTKELNRLRSLEQGLSDFQNDMMPFDTAQEVYSWLESTTGFKNIYKEDHQ